MKQITDRLRMIFFGLFVIVVGLYSPRACMRVIGQVAGEGEDNNPIRIRERHRQEFLKKYKD